MPDLDISAQQENLAATIGDALAKARELGAGQAEVSASAASGLLVTVRKQETETLEYHRDRFQ